MHVTRDRKSRPVDISSMLPNAQRRVNLVVDVPGLQWKGLSTKVSTEKTGGVINKISRGRVGARRRMYRWYVNIDKENQRPNILRQSKASILPYWYPRTPLRDITSIVRAIERKRAKLRNDQTTEAEASVSNTQLQHETSNLLTVPQECKVVDQKEEDADSPTPQKTLLNSIEEVRQVWLEDQRKLERTPAAKKAERKKRIRILMSMR
ncbi:unnamed protein product [Amaranthus hypochondriacus]